MPQDDRNVYMVTEMCDGGTLEQYIRVRLIWANGPSKSPSRIRLLVFQDPILPLQHTAEVTEDV